MAFCKNGDAPSINYIKKNTQPASHGNFKLQAFIEHLPPLPDLTSSSGYDPSRVGVTSSTLTKPLSRPQN